jgi:hypothetical protein
MINLFNKSRGKTKTLYVGTEEQTANIPTGDCSDNDRPCPQLPGTILRIFIPAGAVINLLNLIEIDSPSGICLIVRLPFLGGGNLNTIQSLIKAVQQAGGTAEFARQ